MSETNKYDVICHIIGLIGFGVIMKWILKDYVDS